MACLIFAGEAIFSLPFHPARFFRKTLLLALGITNEQLGGAQAAYGVTAMIAYFPGGLLADRFEARSLLSASLVVTGLGGLYFATFPSPTGLALVYGFWGVSTILLFWGALIRATRQWGGQLLQGRAFGLLDGGRGLLAALLASAAAFAFASVFPDDPQAVDDAARRSVVRTVLWGYTAVTFVAAGLVWLTVPPREERAAITPDVAPVPDEPAPRDTARHVRDVLRRPAVWLQAAIVVSAYVAYKGFDNTSLYAVEVWGMSEASAGAFIAGTQWMRPVAALGAGLLADRFSSSSMVVACFAALIGVDAYFAMASPGPLWILVGNALVSCAAMYGLRGIYFALFEEARVPAAATGTAVGVVSVVGYTPDIFVAWIFGALTTRSPGLTGHQHVFVFLGAFALAGLVAALAFRRLTRLRPAGVAGG